MTDSPSNLDYKLRHAWHAQQRFFHLRGLCLLAGTLVVLIFLDFAVDRPLLLPGWARAVLLVLNLAALAAVVLVGWSKYVHRYNPLFIALRVEKIHPELNTSLVSYVEFRDDRPVPPGVSAGLMEAARGQAARVAAPLDFSAIVPWSKLTRPALVAAVAFLFIAIFAVAQPRTLATLLGRMVNPASSAEYPTRTTIVPMTEDLVCRQSDSTMVEAQVKREIPSSGTLYIKTAGTAWEAADMTVKGDRFSHIFPSVYQDFDYRFAIGDAVSKTFHVAVVAPPRIIESKVTLEYPPYTALPKETVDVMNLKVPEDTKISWALKMDRPLAKVELTQEGAPENTKAALSADGQTVTLTMSATASIAYSFRWTDLRFHYSYDGPRHYIQMQPDQAPHVGLVAPAADQRATLKLQLPIRYWARDDWGISNARIIYWINDIAEEKAKDIGPPAGPEGQATWNVKDSIPDLKEGDIVTFCVEVADNRVFGEKTPHLVRSKSLRVQFLSEGDYLADVMSRRAKVLSAIKPAYLLERQAAEHVKAMGGAKEVAP